MPESNPRKFRGHDDGAFEMNMRIDKTGNQITAGSVYILRGAVFPADTGDDATGDGDVTLLPARGKDIEKARIAYHKVGLFLSGSDPDQAPLFFELACKSLVQCFHTAGSFLSG